MSFHVPAHKNTVNPAAQIAIEPTTGPDFRSEQHGHNIVILTPVSKAGRAWAAEYLPETAARWNSGYVIEPRFFADVVDGIDACGLVIA